MDKMNIHKHLQVTAESYNLSLESVYDSDFQKVGKKNALRGCDGRFSLEGLLQST